MTAIDSPLERGCIGLNRLPGFPAPDESNRALDQLERAVALGRGEREWIQDHSDLASLHGNPRFRDVPGRIH